jgi:hypothetical protein
MRYLKTFEEENIEPNIGDYILMISKKWKGRDEYKEYDDYIDFVNNNLGVITHSINNFATMVYLVKYDNMPYKIDDWLKTHGSRDKLFKVNQKNTIRITKHDNFISSDNLEDFEHIIAANKYNL